MKLLMGLNEIHNSVSEQTLANDLMPNLREIYNTMRRNEKQKGIQRTIHLDALDMYAGPRMHNNDSRQADLQSFLQCQSATKSEQVSSNTGQNNDDRANLYCTYCQLKGHTKEMYYKLIGYLPGYMNNKKIMAKITGMVIVAQLTMLSSLSLFLQVMTQGLRIHNMRTDFLSVQSSSIKDI